MCEIDQFPTNQYHHIGYLDEETCHYMLVLQVGPKSTIGI